MIKQNTQSNRLVKLQSAVRDDYVFKFLMMLIMLMMFGFLWISLYDTDDIFIRLFYSLSLIFCVYSYMYFINELSEIERMRRVYKIVEGWIKE